ncbi:hypothetical protein OIO90_006058 [Microbotryomycetes sp. JL221]|nr:hypothetical protein OIO90_006058 [Microbotryomycetes sp. JL221]
MLFEKWSKKSSSTCSSNWFENTPPRLPTELILYILEIATTIHEDNNATNSSSTSLSQPNQYQQILTRLSLVNHEFKHWSQKKLYSKLILISSNQIEKLNKTFKKSIHLIQYVKQIQIDGLDRQTKLIGFRLNVTRNLPSLLQTMAKASHVQGHQTTRLNKLIISNALILSSNDFMLPKQQTGLIETLLNRRQHHQLNATQIKPLLDIDSVEFNNTLFSTNKQFNLGNSHSLLNIFSNTRSLTLKDTLWTNQAANLFLSRSQTFSSLERLLIKGWMPRLVSDLFTMTDLGLFEFDQQQDSNLTNHLEELCIIEKPQSNTLKLLNDKIEIKIKQELNLKNKLLSNQIKKDQKQDQFKKLTLDFKVLQILNLNEVSNLLSSLESLSIIGSNKYKLSCINKRPFELSDNERWIQSISEMCQLNQVELDLC